MVNRNPGHLHCTATALNTKILKFTLKKIAVMILKFELWFHNTQIRTVSKDASDRKNVDPDQTAPSGTFWSGFTLFAYACLSTNLGS